MLPRPLLFLPLQSRSWRRGRARCSLPYPCCRVGRPPPSFQAQHPQCLSSKQVGIGCRASLVQALHKSCSMLHDLCTTIGHMALYGKRCHSVQLSISSTSWQAPCERCCGCCHAGSTSAEKRQNSTALGKAAAAFKSVLTVLPNGPHAHAPMAAATAAAAGRSGGAPVACPPLFKRGSRGAGGGPGQQEQGQAGDVEMADAGEPAAAAQQAVHKVSSLFPCCRVGVVAAKYRYHVITMDL